MYILRVKQECALRRLRKASYEFFFRYRLTAYEVAMSIRCLMPSCLWFFFFKIRCPRNGKEKQDFLFHVILISLIDRHV